MSVKLREVSPHHFTIDPDTEEAIQIATQLKWYSPKYSPKDVPRFIDIAGVTENPKLFKLVINILAEHYRAMAVEKRPTHILGFDARGFLLGTPLALALEIPFVMMRKANKSPGPLIESNPYHKEYAEIHPETMAIRADSVPKGSRVALIDDLIATGGTAITGFELVQACGATVVELAAVTGIPFFNAVAKIHSFQDGKFKDVDVFTLVNEDNIPDSACGDPKDLNTPRVRKCGGGGVN